MVPPQRSCTSDADVLDAISRLEGHGDKLEGIRFTDGNFLQRSALFFSPGQYQRSHLAEQLGYEFCEDTNCIQCCENAATNIPGLYAAGNASRGVQLVIAAAAEGMEAAFAISNASSKRILRVMRCAITSRGKLRPRITLRLETKPLTESPGNSLSIRRGAGLLPVSFRIDDTFGQSVKELVRFTFCALHECQTQFKRP